MHDVTLSCPRCGTRCHLMAGINVKPTWVAYRVWVCWSCAIAKLVRANSTWEPLKSATTKLQWKKNSQHHWQTIVHGEVLDYWPSKRKWRFRDQSHVGDVEKFVRALRDQTIRPGLAMDGRGASPNRADTSGVQTRPGTSRQAG